MLPSSFTDLATITNYTDGDPAGPFNNPQPVATPQTPWRALSQPQSSLEQADNRDTTVTRRELFLAPGGPALSATSSLVLASLPGVVWQVVGDPETVAYLGGRISHVAAVIQRITG